MPSDVVAFHIRVGRDIGTVHEARIVRNYLVVGRLPAVRWVDVRVELKSEEVDVPAAVEDLARSSELAFDVIVIIVIETGTVAAH